MYKKLIILSIISLFLISCNSNREIRVGFAGSLSGPSHEIGIAAKNGYQLAIDELNSHPDYESITFVPVIRDDGSDPEKALEVVTDLKNASVDVAIGFITSNMYPAVVKANEENLLLISPSMSTPKLSDMDDNFLRVISSMEFEARELARHTLNIGVNKIAIIYEMSNDVYSVKYHEEFVDEFAIRESEVVYETALDHKDYDALVSQIIESKANGLCLVTSAHTASEILQRLQVRKIDIPIALSQWTMSMELIEQAGQSADGAYGYSTYNKNLLTEDYQSFRDLYYERFQIEPAFISITTYEATKILCESLTNHDNINSIKKDIIGKTYTGLQNDFAMNEFGDSSRIFYLVHIKDGSIIPYE
ncbi:ABC transporter substrate-binding protein [Acidaminobacter sp. JC074]|uniref:ABC transporter substrate-binding protein n=1 Tax=Acidaminobacter sp. JC074 TaxID=2530199 RepID=UPI001F0DE515|nr:ABC transporter substrate-binding protein [Acidaminobacter sp. JC074]